MHAFMGSMSKYMTRQLIECWVSDWEQFQLRSSSPPLQLLLKDGELQVEGINVMCKYSAYLSKLQLMNLPSSGLNFKLLRFAPD